MIHKWGFPKIGVPPKSSILMDFSIINHPSIGEPPMESSKWTMHPDPGRDPMCRDATKCALSSLSAPVGTCGVGAQLAQQITAPKRGVRSALLAHNDFSGGQLVVFDAETVKAIGSLESCHGPLDLWVCPIGS